MDTIKLRRLVVVLTVGTLFGLLAAPIAATPLEETPSGGTSNTYQLLLVHELFDRVFNENDADAAAVLVASHATITTNYGEFTGPEGLLEYLRLVKLAYMDVAFDITSVHLDAAVTVKWRMTARVYNGALYSPEITTNITRDGVATIDFDLSRVTSLSLQTQSIVYTGPESDAEVAVVQPGCVQTQPGGYCPSA